MKYLAIFIGLCTLWYFDDGSIDNILLPSINEWMSNHLWLTIWIIIGIYHYFVVGGALGKLFSLGERLTEKIENTEAVEERNRVDLLEQRVDEIEKKLEMNQVNENNIY